MSKDELENEIKSFYYHKFNISGNLLNIVETYDILDLCARGRSNLFISNKLEIDDEFFISNALDYAFNFYGWKEDLDTDTREHYLRYRPNKYAFINTLTTLYPLIIYSDAVVAWEINEQLDKYIKRLDECENAVTKI